jgi:transcriptional regulator with XRE-family HTH domain
MDAKARLRANLRRLRQQKGWSQEELAEQAGLHRTYVSGVERMTRNPTLTVLERLALALDVSIGELTS